MPVPPPQVWTRFIPAGAGNSATACCVTVTAPVYPRWRGELIGVFSFDAGFYGLSPLARGTLTPDGIDEFPVRFIPAGAGNSVWFAPAASGSTVYPRWRGELNSPIRIILCFDGLSPLARGTRQSLTHGAWPARFIPAGAGNSESSPVVVSKTTVYPRWRGELRAGINTG